MLGREFRPYGSTQGRSVQNDGRGRGYYRFPTGLGAHLAEGWHMNYWAPMKALLEAK